MNIERNDLSRLPYTSPIDVAYTKHPSGAATISARVPVPRSNAGWLVAGFCLGIGVSLLVSRE